MKKNLIITDFHPLPEDNGKNIRTMNFVRFFLKYGPIDLAYSNVFPRELIEKDKNHPCIAKSAYDWNNGWNACLRDIKTRFGL